MVQHADTILSVETNDVPTLIDYVRHHHTQSHFDGILTVCDYYIDTVVDVAEALALPSPFSTQVKTARLKHRMRAALDRSGLPNPAYRITHTWEDTCQAAAEIGYPLVIKPSDLASSAYVRCVRGEDELREAFEALNAFPLNFRQQPREQLYLLEAYMAGEEVSVEACTVAGQTTIVGITDKRTTGFPFFIEDGHMFPADLDSTTTTAICELTCAALHAVGYDHGISHTEVKLTPHGPRIVEINPRPGGNYICELVQRVTGIDLLAAMVRLALGEEPNLHSIPTGNASAAVQFIIPTRTGYVTGLHGTERLAATPGVVRWELHPVVGSSVATPIDNACYLGHVVTVDPRGFGARQRAEQAAQAIELEFADSVAAIQE